MCGICGVFEYGRRRRPDEALAKRMSDTLRHRGPDDEGIFADDHVTLAARRLAIIDLEGGHQPMCNEDGSVRLVFNGEIYNFADLRRELIRQGHRFRTRSDTEVILRLYEEHGPSCLELLDGMFALALHDRRPGAEAGQNGPGRLMLARDRMGKKPLYYATIGTTLVFGSELKPILLHPDVDKQLDVEALHHYLSLLVVPAPFSIFASIRKLPAGHILLCDSGGPEVSRYWDYLDHVGTEGPPTAEAVREIRVLLRHAVQKRLISDVPLGAFLSGGLDSSTVVALMSGLMPQRVKTFSIGFEGPRAYNELPHARAVARRFNTDHHEYLVKPDVVSTIETVAHYADEPLAVSSAIPTYLLSQAARDHVTVVLTGDGGDEMFGGYETYRYERWSQAFRHLPAAGDRVARAAARPLSNHVERPLGRWANRIDRFVATARESDGHRRLGWASGFSEAEKRALLGTSPAGGQAPPSTALLLETTVRGLNGVGPVARQNAMDVLVSLPDEMLAKVDRMTMGASVEARCPMLDGQLVEYTAGLGFDVKVKGWGRRGLKHLLRASVSDLLPPEIVNRSKHGFVVPLDDWFRGEARPYVESILAPARVKRRGVFDPARVSAVLADHQAGRTNASNRLYALLMFEVWAQEYL